MATNIKNNTNKQNCNLNNPKYYMNLLIFLSSLFAIGLKAQLSVPGSYRDLVVKSLEKSVTLGGEENLLTFHLPNQNNAELLAEVESEEVINSENKLTRKNDIDGANEIIYSNKPPKTNPFTFGKALLLDVRLDYGNATEWTYNEETNTRMWRFKVYSKDAHSISIYFSEFYMKPGSELYIIGKEDTLGAFTSLNNKEDRGFGISPVSGDFLILEYIEPLTQEATAAVPPTSIVVSHIVHGFRQSPFSMKSGTSGNCHINIACPLGSGKTNSINSVALLINRKGTAFCTGAMINNVKEDGRQLFLTAEHCVGSDSVVNNMVGFHYQFKYCNSAFETKPQIKTVHGMRLLQKSGVSDFALLEVIEEIPSDWDVYMSGWDASNIKTKTGSFYGIHHPRGDTKKISTFTGTIDLVRLVDINDGINFWQIPKWDRGTTEPGSSGSPLFDSDGYIIGHLLGGDSSCTKTSSPDYYGALSRDWLHPSNSIISHLDPDGQNVKQVRGVALKDLRNPDAPVTESDPDTNPGNQVTVTVSVTQTITKTYNIVSTITVAKTKNIVTSTKTITEAAATITQTFVRNPPPIISVKTVTVTK